MAPRVRDEAAARAAEMWDAGDYAAVGAKIVPVAERLIDRMDLAGGARVLDIATGTGNAAIAAARGDCEVVGIDFAVGLLQSARARAEGDRFAIEFREADAGALPFEDASFDAVVSVFGVMFAPDQERAAAEVLRVCRPGGRIGLAAWTPDGMVGEMFGILARHAPPPPAPHPPTAWGTRARLDALLGGGVDRLEVAEHAHVFRYRTPESFGVFHGGNFGPVKVTLEALDQEGREVLQGDLADMVRRWNRRDDGAVSAPGAYLEVVATRA